MRQIAICVFIALSMFTMSACIPKPKYNLELDQLIRDSLPIWMSNVNAYYFAYIDSNNQIIEQYRGNDAGNDPIDENTIFEAASLSKTVTAYLFWKLYQMDSVLLNECSARICNTLDNKKIHTFDLLQHKLFCNTDCIEPIQNNQFEYSENAYLLLQKILEDQYGQSLEELAQKFVFTPIEMSKSTFVSKNFHSYLNGFLDANEKARLIYEFTTPLSHGSLYTTGKDMLNFIKYIRQDGFLEFVSQKRTEVVGFSSLQWGLGMGIEKTAHTEWFWQWGSNWCYNHILMLDKDRGRGIIGMSNSVQGAKRWRESIELILGEHHVMFDYINWY